MSSGLGLKGNVGRCYPFYEDFASCMKIADEPLKSCYALRNDYLECLHHRKERARVLVIKETEARSKSESGHDGGGGGHH